MVEQVAETGREAADAAHGDPAVGGPQTIRLEPEATSDIGGYFFAMTMLPLKVESSRIALPSPYVPLSERRLRSG